MAMRWMPIACYVATIVLANAALALVGLIPVGFGLLAPAGVLFAGLSLGARDWVRETSGRWAAYGAIAGGALLSLLVAPSFALPSATAFAISEVLDALAYEPLRRRGAVAALVGSNAVGLVVDSAVFLWLAFGSLDYLGGQIVGKAEVTLATVAILVAWRARRSWSPGSVGTGAT